MPPLQQSKSVLVKIGLLGTQGTVLRQNPISQCLLVKLGLLGLEEDTISADDTAVAELAGEARRLGIAEWRPMTKSEFAKSSDGAGSSRFKANGMNSAVTTALVMSVGEARPAGFVKHSVKSESEPELTESSEEDSSSDEDEAGPGPEQVVRPAPPQQQQSQSLLVEFGLLGLQSALTASRRT